MQKNKIHLLSTAPLGKALVKKAAENDIMIHEASFIKTVEIKNVEIEQRIHKLASQKITAVFTSMNAVDAVVKLLPAAKILWTIFCVGNTTKKAVTKFFDEENIYADAENAEQLSQKILQQPSVRNIVFFCGDQRRDELPVALKKNGIEVEELVVYKTVETPRVLTGNYDGILFFSPSAVKSFFLNNVPGSDTRLFAIGTTTANALKHFAEKSAIIPAKPSKENLVMLAIENFGKSKIY